jgi:gamma-glutamyltranspeptidase
MARRAVWPRNRASMRAVKERTLVSSGQVTRKTVGNRDNGRVTSSSYIASYAPMLVEGAITLAAAVANEVYSLLTRPPATGVGGSQS